jgi:hypothetical protein
MLIIFFISFCSVLAPPQSSPSQPPFGKAVLVVGQEQFDISSVISEQTISQPYRLLPSMEGDEPYRLKEVVLRLDGVQHGSKHAIQVKSELSSLFL